MGGGGPTRCSASGYWGWDRSNGSLIPWLSNIALLHGLLVQRVPGASGARIFLAITSYVLVLYASFLTRSGVLADFSVHSFVNLGLNGFLLSFLFVTMAVGYGTLLVRWRDIPGPRAVLGSFSRESMMWLGQLVFMLMCALTAVGMSAPLITRLFGRRRTWAVLPTTSECAARDRDGLLLGIARSCAGVTEAGALLRSARRRSSSRCWWRSGPWSPAHWIDSPRCCSARVRTRVEAIVTARGFRHGWKHGVAYLGHTGAAVLLIGVIASSNYGRKVQVTLPQGQERQALDYRLIFQGVKHGADGRDRVMIAVNAPEKHFEAMPAMYWSEFNQGYMKKPHIERFLTHDIYISPLEMLGGDDPNTRGVWFSKGETKQIGQVKYTFVDFDRQMGDVVRIAARLRVEIGGRTVPVRPILEMNLQSGVPNRIPDYLPGGGSVQIANVDPNTGRVALELPGMGHSEDGRILAVEVSTKPLINLVWVGAILMLGSAFLSVLRRTLDLKRTPVSPPAAPAA
jgi:cytochrome c-type biogenesis protein CcmF